jgi:hypothetical protein
MAAGTALSGMDGLAEMEVAAIGVSGDLMVMSRRWTQGLVRSSPYHFSGDRSIQSYQIASEPYPDHQAQVWDRLR